MKLLAALSLLCAASIASPLLAGPPAAKRPACPSAKTSSRDARRVEPCRKPAIPPLFDQAPLFLVATAPSRAALSDLS